MYCKAKAKVEEAGLKKIFRDQIGNHTHALHSIVFARVGIILFLLFVFFRCKLRRSKCKIFFSFVSFSFVALRARSVALVRHCIFLVPHLYPSCVPSLSSANVNDL